MREYSLELRVQGLGLGDLSLLVLSREYGNTIPI